MIPARKVHACIRVFLLAFFASCGGPRADRTAGESASGRVGPLDIIIDTDTAISVPTGLDVDDDLAVLFALGSMEVRVLGLTVTYGNADITQTYPDALRLMALAGATQIPVRRGAGWFRRDLNEPTEATRFLIDSIRSSQQEKITVVGIGAMSNLAAALTQDPSIEERIERIVLMGGNLKNGLIDLNFAAHPEATEILLGTSIPKYVIPTETCVQTTFTQSQLEIVKARPESVVYAFLPRLETFADMWSVLGELLYADYPDRESGGFFPWDVVALAYVVRPDIFREESCFEMRMKGPSLQSEACDDLEDHHYRVTVPTKVASEAFRTIALERICSIQRVQE